MTVADDLATPRDERIPEIVRAWERANAAMPPANPTNADDPSTNLATLAAIAHAKWRRAEAAEAEVARLRDGLREYLCAHDHRWFMPAALEPNGCPVCNTITFRLLAEDGAA